MPQTIVIKRTTTADAGFQLLVSLLDHELWNQLKENQAAYDPYNKVPNIKTTLLIYANEKPVACGCFKEYDTDTVEIKKNVCAKSMKGQGPVKKSVAGTVAMGQRERISLRGIRNQHSFCNRLPIIQDQRLRPHSELPALHRVDGKRLHEERAGAI